MSTSIDWRPRKEEPPLGVTLLLWYRGAEAPVTGFAFRVRPGRRTPGWSFSSSLTRGQEPTHWAEFHSPYTKKARYITSGHRVFTR